MQFWVWKSENLTVKKTLLTSFCAYVFQFEGLWCLKGKYGIALLNDVKIVVIITKRTMKTIIVHFSQNELKEEKETGLRWIKHVFCFKNVQKQHSHCNIAPYPAFALVNIYIFILPALINECFHSATTAASG